MRALIALIALSGGCSSTNEDATNATAITQLRADLEALKAQLAAAPDPVTAAAAAVAPVEKQLGTLQARVDAIRALHLLAYAGTPQEVDLGYSTAGSRCAVNAAAGGEVCFDANSVGQAAFVGPNCTGQAIVDAQADPSSVLLRLADGVVYQIEPHQLEVTPGSVLGRGGDCGNVANGVPRWFQPITERARFPMFKQADLSVALR